MPVISVIITRNITWRWSQYYTQQVYSERRRTIHSGGGKGINVWDGPPPAPSRIPSPWSSHSLKWTTFRMLWMPSGSTQDLHSMCRRIPPYGCPVSLSHAVFYHLYTIIKSASIKDHPKYSSRVDSPLKFISLLGNFVDTFSAYFRTRQEHTISKCKWQTKPEKQTENEENIIPNHAGGR